MDSRIVITGCGAITPAGQGVDAMWSALEQGRPLASPLRDPAFASLGFPPAMLVPDGLADRFPFPQSRPASLMALAADEAVRQAGWGPDVLADPNTGLSASTSKGDIDRLVCLRSRWLAGGLFGLGEEFRLAWPDGPAVLVRRRLGMIGPLICPVAACATGTHALVRAVRMIAAGEASRVLVAAADASVVPLTVGAFAAMGVLTRDVGRPFDRDRSGFVIGEGAAAVTVERADTAVGRPLAAIDAAAMTADPTGLAAQDASGRTLAQSLSRLLALGRRDPPNVALYAAHATATELNDLVESAAVNFVFGRHRPPVMAPKAVLGHLLGASGLTEIVAAVAAMTRSTVPPLANLRNLDERCPIRVSAEAEQADLPTACCVSLGFGGHHGLVLLSRAG